MTTPPHLRPPLRHALAGEIDLGRAGDVRAEIETLLPRATDGLEIDLARVTFLDSAGLRALETAIALGARRGVRVDLVDPSPAARRLLAWQDLGRGPR